MLLALWLTQRPYLGIRHDGILYLGQLLWHVKPEVMAGDLFFAYGSQDSFSVFSTLLLPLYLFVGVAHAQMIVVLAAQIGTLAALVQLLRELPIRSAAWLGLATFAALSPFYANAEIFSVSEGFVTARTLAEPLTLWALAALMAQRRWTALLLLAAAAACHPLMALPAAVIGWLLMCQSDRRWWWAALIGLVPVVFAMLGIAPFSNLLHRYDDGWWALVEAVNGHVLLLKWSGPAWQLLIVDMALLAGAAAVAPCRLASLCRATLIATVGLCLASLIGADMARNELLTPLQLWRVLWIAHVLALCCAPMVLANLWQRSDMGQMAALAVAAAIMAAGVGWYSGWPLLAWAALAGWAAWRGLKVSRSLQLFACGASVLCIAGLSGFALMARLDGAMAFEGTADAAPTWLIVATTPVVSLAIAAALFRVLKKPTSAGLWTTGIVACGLLVIGISHWDRRSAWTKAVEAGQSHVHPFDALIPLHATVYWPDELAATWNWLKRPSHYVKAQGAGLLFNHGTARDFGGRWAAYAPVRKQAEGCKVMAALTAHGHQTGDAWAQCMAPSTAFITQLCRGAVHPDFMILEADLKLPAIAAWHWTAPGATDRNFNLYACTQFL